ncbi:hypothetical protein [uncultured Fusobacterium sp.]|uniref:hypothetical protein n=1 Tax=uncultured Fusobacterium sp. TaxID=159267 RepID=UPI0027DC82A0|nr:hypothetical protein [uncultured Fusobacterium sp.]
MNKLVTTMFNNIELDFYTLNGEILLSMDQLSKGIGYKNKRNAEELLKSNPELLGKEFSFLLKIDNLEGGVIKAREKRFFTEDGLMEAAFLANTEQAKLFRKFARELIKKVEKGELALQVKENLPKEIEKKLDVLGNYLREKQQLIEQLNEDNQKIIIPYLEKLDNKMLELEGVKKELIIIKKKFVKLELIVTDLLKENMNNRYER